MNSKPSMHGIKPRRRKRLLSSFLTTVSVLHNPESSTTNQRLKGIHTQANLHALFQQRLWNHNVGIAPIINPYHMAVDTSIDHRILHLISSRVNFYSALSWPGNILYGIIFLLVSASPLLHQMFSHLGDSRPSVRRQPSWRLQRVCQPLQHHRGSSFKLHPTPPAIICSRARSSSKDPILCYVINLCYLPRGTFGTHPLLEQMASQKIVSPDTSLQAFKKKIQQPGLTTSIVKAHPFKNSTVNDRPRIPLVIYRNSEVMRYRYQ